MLNLKLSWISLAGHTKTITKLFFNSLLNIDWNNLYQCDDVNTAWNIMLQNITTVIDEMCPLKRYKISQAKVPWVTNEILELIKNKDRLLRRAKNKKKRT